MDFKSILLAQKTGYIPRNHFDALFARRIGGAVLKDFPGLPASIVTVTDAVAKPLDSLKVAITPVQSGSGDPSPDNIRPISGWSGVEVKAGGVNLFDGDITQLAFGIYAEGDKIISYPSYRSIFARVKSGKIYTVSRKTIEGNRFRVAATVDYPAHGALCQVLANDYQQDNALTVTVTIPDGYNYIFVYLSNRNDSCTASNYQIELGSTATTYEPYTGTTYPITFPSEAGTVYGGTLDVTNGTLTVTHTAETYDGTEDWIALSESRGYYKAIDGSGYSKNEILKSSFLIGTSAGSSASMPLNSIMLNSSKTNLLCRVDTTSDFPTLDSWKAFLTQNNLTVVYPLAEPQTYQLTPTEVQMLLGTNNLWADTGDILEGKYYAKK